MAEPWEEDWEGETKAEGGSEPWDEDWGGDDNTSKSENAAKDLRFLGVDPVGAGEAMLAVGSGLANEAARGVAGIAGTGAGLIEGAFEGVGLAEDDNETPNAVGNKWLEAVPDFTYEPRTLGGQWGVKGAGAGMENVVEEVKKTGSPAAYAGARVAGASPEEASLSMQDYMDQPNALGEGAFQVTGNPWVATIVQMLPELAAAGFPVKKGPVRTPRKSIAPDMPEPGFGGVGSPDIPAPRRGAPPGAPEGTILNQLRAAIKKNDKQKIMELVNANPAIVAAFEHLNIEFTPGMVSESMPIRQTEAALGSVADSNIPTLHKGVQGELTARAEKLVKDSGGDPNSPATMADNIETAYDDIHAGYVRREKAGWDELREKIPRGSPMDLEDAARGVYERVTDAGRRGNIEDGLLSVSKHDRELFRMTHERVPVETKRMHEGKEITDVTYEWQYTEPKYAAIDAFRRKLGRGMDGMDDFRGADAGELDFLYRQMAEAQGRVAIGNNYGELWRSTNNLTIGRKALEESMKRVGGARLNQSVVTRLKTATRSLMDGDVKKWDQLFDDLPVDQRSAAAAQALTTVLFTAGKGTRLSESFLDNFLKIKRDPKLRDRLFKELPPESRKTFMNIGEAASGFYRMMDRSLSNPSGTAVTQYIIRKLEDPGFLDKIFGGAIDKTTGRVPVMGEWVSTMFRRTKDQKQAQATARLTAGANLLSDPALRRAIIEYAAGKVEAANKILVDSKSWADWIKTQPIPQQARIRAAGIVALFDEDQQ